MNKKGYTLVEIISVIALIAVICGLFVLNFSRKNNNQLEENYNNEIKKMESAADTYVMTNKSSNDSKYEIIKYTAANEDESFCYITIHDLVNDGFLNEIPINPKTNEEFEGVIKFTKYKDGAYDFKYIDDAEGYILFVYEKNGATSVGRHVQAVTCDSSDKNDVIDCAKNITLPSIIRKNGTVYGWSTNKNDTRATYLEGANVRDLLINSNFDVQKNRIYIYAISEGEMSATWINMNGEKTTKTCTLVNDQRYCEIDVPESQIESTDDYKERVECTNSKYIVDEENGKVTISNNEELQCKYEVKDLEIKQNKIKKITSTDTVEVKINLILVLDVSGSMSSNSRLSNLKTVSKEMARKLNLNNSTVSIITFQSSASTVLSYSSDLSKIDSAINSLSAGGNTSFLAAIGETASFMTKSVNDKDNYVIFLSDGYSADTPTTSNVEFVKSHAKVYTIGIGGASSSQLIPIATSKNNYYSYDDVSDKNSLEGLYKIFDDIITDITIEIGAGEENANGATAGKGILNLGKSIINDKNPFEVYYNSTLLNSYTKTNQYLTSDGTNYLFNVYKYAVDKGIAYANVGNLRFSYIYEEE